MVQEHGLKLDTLHPSALKWAYTGKEVSRHRLNIDEKQKLDVASSGHVTALTARQVSCLVARLLSQIGTSMWRYVSHNNHEAPTDQCQAS
jgi:hypothetical protein